MEGLDQYFVAGLHEVQVEARRAVGGAVARNRRVSRLTREWRFWIVPGPGFEGFLVRPLDDRLVKPDAFDHDAPHRFTGLWALHFGAPGPDLGQRRGSRCRFRGWFRRCGGGWLGRRRAWFCGWGHRGWRNRGCLHRNRFNDRSDRRIWSSGLHGGQGQFEVLRCSILQSALGNTGAPQLIADKEKQKYARGDQ